MIDWTKTAFVFPGQGSQLAGMGKALASAYPVARETFEEADEVLGRSISALCFDLEQDELDKTENTQPALFVTSIALLRALQHEIPDAQPSLAAGHSLGELTALAAVGAVQFVDALRLVERRGQLMKAAGEANPGAMAAVLGLDAPVVRDVCARASQQTGGQVVLANDNCPGQAVISGDSASIDAALALAKEAGAKRMVTLAVSIAAHSPLMTPAAAEFEEAVNATTFTVPDVPVFANASAQPMTTVDAIRAELAGQLRNPVNWTDSVRAMIDAGATTFVEVGPKNVLTGLLRRIDRSVSGVSVDTAEALQALQS